MRSLSKERKNRKKMASGLGKNFVKKGEGCGFGQTTALSLMINQKTERNNIKF
jgi:hypothetical protein